VQGEEPSFGHKQISDIMDRFTGREAEGIPPHLQFSKRINEQTHI
jgi:hypothetical protein